MKPDVEDLKNTSISLSGKYPGVEVMSREEVLHLRP